MASVDTAIESFRDAAILPARWPQALDVLAQTFNSDGATLVLKATKMSSIAVSTSIRPFVPLYLSGPIRDPREDRVNPSLREGFMPDHAYFSSQEIAHDPYYQEFMGPRGFGWNAIACLHGDLMVSVKRAFKRGPYEGSDLQALNAVLPAMRAVSRTACMTWHSNFMGQLNAFERLLRGAVLLDAKGRVLHANACVRFGDGLDAVGGFLSAPRAADRHALRRFLSAVLIAGEKGPIAAPLTLTLPRPSGARPWLLDGTACTEAIRSLHSSAAALVLITDLDQTPHPESALLRQLFGLTASECVLACALSAGASLRESAARMSISEGHARQRLKSVFRKTQTSRQGELIRLLAKLG